MWAARYFHPYLLGHHTTVFTDQSACVSVLGTARPSGKIARWALTIQELNLTLKHRAGKFNSNADALSHNPISESRSEDGVCCCDGDRGFSSVSCGCDDRCGRCECIPGNDCSSNSEDNTCRGCGIYNGCGCNTGSVVPDDRDDHCCSCSGLVDTAGFSPGFNEGVAGRLPNNYAHCARGGRKLFTRNAHGA